MLIFILIQEYADDVLFSPCASITESFELGPFPGISGNIYINTIYSKNTFQAIGDVWFHCCFVPQTVLWVNRADDIIPLWQIEKMEFDQACDLKVKCRISV